MGGVMIKDVMKIVDKLDESQLKLEKDAFDVINSSDTSLNLVKEGMGQIEVLIQTIEELNRSVQMSQQNVEHMKAVSTVIADFAKVLAGIANKTNMLSLNASIEAARAGEQGQGFAVVAKEVQKLATQSKTSSGEITNRIQEVQSYVQSVIESMNTIYQNVEKQTEMADTVGGLLNKILDAAMVANDVSRNIENEIAYQHDITEEARQALREI